MIFASSRCIVFEVRVQETSICVDCYRYRQTNEREETIKPVSKFDIPLGGEVSSHLLRSCECLLILTKEIITTHVDYGTGHLAVSIVHHSQTFTG